MKHIMVATDFSERSDRALRRAILLARDAGAKISLVTAVDEDRPQRLIDEERAEAEALLREMSATIRDQDHIDCQARVIVAEPSQAIVRLATEMAPDLLVIGPHRRRIFRDIFVGTTAERTVRDAPCPVLMVNATPAAPYRNVLLTTDLGEASRNAIAHYLRMGLAGLASHTMLHVFEADMPRLATAPALTEREKNLHIEDARRDAAVALSSFIGSLDDIGAQLLLRHAGAAMEQEILAGAAEISADLIVLAPHGKHGVEKWLLGSVAEKVLRDAEVDVLAIPARAG